jgi:hypothetical protein
VTGPPPRPRPPERSYRPGQSLHRWASRIPRRPGAWTSATGPSTLAHMNHACEHLRDRSGAPSPNQGATGQLEDPELSRPLGRSGSLVHGPTSGARDGRASGTAGCLNHEDAVASAAAYRCSRTAPSGLTTIRAAVAARQSDRRQTGSVKEHRRRTRRRRPRTGWSSLTDMAWISFSAVAKLLRPTTVANVCLRAIAG